VDECPGRAQRRRVPEDWWPYGISANRTTLDTYLRHHYEQGLSTRRWKIDEVFAPELLDAQYCSSTP
jgi:hypothetical protein